MNEQPASSLPSTFDDGDLYDLIVRDIPYGLDFYFALAREAQGQAAVPFGSGTKKR